MLVPLTIGLLAVSAVLALIAGHHLVRRKVVDDLLIVVSAVIEVGLLATLVVGLARSGAITDGGERATFIAYLFTVLLVLPVTILIAIKERGQWAMGIMVSGALVVMILLGRLQQVWSPYA
ncbi:hypothetical protein BA895_15990 [Humibacillus sp. DSM 29435]|uniref:hypothetical protein n=1 Tax=Humibacillus sp. DSM 29435 TaxID=1869167 RepID=UPI000872CE80|nr:hypothetical protein [Humibacillus sp. DSM 29435]OFE17494.1 hypothetical protein BA895_15990 [Humibacillus sp. DSM 29435]